MFASIFSLSTLVALLPGDKSCEPAPPARNLTHFFFRLKQKSLWLVMMMMMMMWHFYKAPYPYLYTLADALQNFIQTALSSLQFCKEILQVPSILEN